MASKTEKLNYLDLKLWNLTKIITTKNTGRISLAKIALNAVATMTILILIFKVAQNVGGMKQIRNGINQQSQQKKIT